MHVHLLQACLVALCNKYFILYCTTWYFNHRTASAVYPGCSHFRNSKYFSSVCSDYNVFSNFTLAFFEDSGWYKVNYTFVNNYDQFELQWGKGIKYITYCQYAS